MNLLKTFDKKNLRKVYLEKRKALTDNELVIMSQRIHDNLVRSIPLQSYGDIHIFLPIKKQNEIDTWLIIKTLWKKFSPVNVIIPKIVGDGEMENYLLTADTKLEENKWGILEPVVSGQQSVVSNSQSRITNHESPISNPQISNPKSIDLVLLPLLIFDKKGNRVGYGKGFYDRFLAECRADVMKIGLSLFEPIDEISDTNEYDVKMDFCVTPNRIWTF